MAKQLYFTEHWSVSDASIDLADVSTNANWLKLNLRGPNLMLQVDVSDATGYVYLQESLNNDNYVTIDDSSLAFDSSVTTTTYVKEWSGLFPGKWVELVIPLTEDVSMLGVIDAITIMNKL